MRLAWRIAVTGGWLLHRIGRWTGRDDADTATLVMSQARSWTHAERAAYRDDTRHHRNGAEGQGNERDDASAMGCGTRHGAPRSVCASPWRCRASCGPSCSASRALTLCRSLRRPSFSRWLPRPRAGFRRGGLPVRTDRGARPGAVRSAGAARLLVSGGEWSVRR